MDSFEISNLKEKYEIDDLVIERLDKKDFELLSDDINDNSSGGKQDFQCWTNVIKEQTSDYKLMCKTYNQKK